MTIVYEKRKMTSKTIISRTAFGLIFLILINTAGVSLSNNNDFFNSFAQDNTNVDTTTPSNIPDNNSINNKTNVKDTFTLSGTIDSLVYAPNNNLHLLLI